MNIKIIIISYLMIPFLLYTACNVKHIADNHAGIKDNTVEDVDGNIYRTIQIGKQIWMAENLRTVSYANGDSIMKVEDSEKWADLDKGAWCSYDNKKNYDEISGKLYNWYAVNDLRNICPEGWVVPTDEEWGVLVDSLGGYQTAGREMKATGINLDNNKLWAVCEEGITSKSGFDVVLTGFRSYDGNFYEIAKTTYFWSSTKDYSVTAWGRGLNYRRDGVIRDFFISYPHENGFSVRCFKYSDED